MFDKSESKVLQYFDNMNMQFSSCRCFYWGCEGDKPHWTVRCQMFFFLWCYALSLNWVLSSQIRLYCTFISAALKSHTVKQLTMCQLTNYHYTTNHSRYLSIAWTGVVRVTNHTGLWDVKLTSEHYLANLPLWLGTRLQCWKVWHIKQ